MPSDSPPRPQPQRVSSAAALTARTAQPSSRWRIVWRVIWRTVALLVFIGAAVYLVHAIWSGIHYSATPQAAETGIVPNVVDLPGMGLSLGAELAIGVGMLALFVGSPALLLATRSRREGPPNPLPPSPHGRGRKARMYL